MRTQPMSHILVDDPTPHRADSITLFAKLVVLMSLATHCRKWPTPALAVFILLSVATAQSPKPAKDVSTIAREAGPSVVRVVLRDEKGMELGSGSGFVVSGDGKVVTNYHVIHAAGTTQAEIRFTDGASYQVRGVLATSEDHDLAVLKLDSVGKQFSPLQMGDSNRVSVGEHVVAIGSPLAGLSTVNTEATISDGIVSGRRDWLNGKMNVLQTTAPISPGSSGGALLNMDGEVIGVTFAQLVEGQNLNFAIPVDYIQSLFHDGSITSLAEINSARPNERHGPEIVPTGSYTGMWQSGKFSVSGAATMTIRMTDGMATAQIFLTGGEVTSAVLSGPAHRTGVNIWTVELVSKHPKLLVRGIFRDNSFVGDYTYTRFLMLDQGQWLLKKE